MLDIRPGERVLHTQDPIKGMKRALSRAVGSRGEVVESKGAVPAGSASRARRVQPENSFDLVISCQLPDCELAALLGEWHRVLRMGGHLWIRLPNDGAGEDGSDGDHCLPASHSRTVLDRAFESGFELREVSADERDTWIHTVKVRPCDPSSLYAL